MAHVCEKADRSHTPGRLHSPLDVVKVVEVPERKENVDLPSAGRNLNVRK